MRVDRFAEGNSKRIVFEVPERVGVYLSCIRKEPPIGLEFDLPYAVLVVLRKEGVGPVSPIVGTPSVDVCPFRSCEV
jgi:hypothetical protein